MRIKSLLLLIALLPLLCIKVEASNLYWINGSGQWTDANHWSMSSGGPTCNCIPSQNDDIIIDQNSFSEEGFITIPSSISIKSLTTLGLNKKVKVNSSTSINFSVKSSLIFNSELTFLLEGNIIFNGNQGGLINTGRQAIKSNILFDGAGTWELQDHLSTAKNVFIEIRKGHLNLNGKDVFSGGLISQSNKSKSISIAESDIFLTNSIDLDHNIIVNTNGTESISLNPSMTVINKGGAGSVNYKQMAVCNSPPNPITVTITVTSDYNGSHITCNGECDGEITVMASSASGGPFSYDFQNTGSFTGQTVYPGLCVGNFTVVVTDSSQEIVPGSNQYWTCSENVNVIEPPVINFGVNLIVNPTCPGVCDGQAFVSAGGGTGTLDIAWANGESGFNPVLMCTGSNYVTITDDNACVHNDSVVILAPTDIFANVDIQHVSCNGFCDGHIVSDPSGGNGAPFSFQWSHDGSIVIDSAGSLCAGSYELTVLDVDGCLIDTTIIITEPTPMIVTPVNQVNLTCFGECIGEIEVTASNGTAPFTFQWFDATTDILVPGQDNDGLAENLCAGDYYVIVTDDNGCTFQSNDFTITQPDEIIPTITPTDVNCFGDCSGTAAATAIGGNPNYNFTWLSSPGNVSQGTGPNISNLCAGDYILEVSDQSACTIQSAPFTINEPTEITVSVIPVDVLCAGDCNGSASATPGGGSVAGNYTIQWHSATTGLISSGTALGTGNILCAGDYFVVAIDDNLCDDTAFFSIEEPDPLTLNPISTDINCFANCDATIDANAGGGVAPYSYVWSNCAPPSPIGGETNPTITGLCAGSYSVEVTDDNGCTINNASACITFTDPIPLDVTITNTTDATCGGACDGSATASTTGGTGAITINWHNSVTDVVVGTGTSINTLCTGTYYAVAIDDNGCEDTTLVFTINDLILVTGVVTPNDATCDGVCDGSATVIPAGGSVPYSYEWVEVAGGTVILSGPLDNIGGLCAGDYTVQVFDINLCASAPIPFTINGNPPITANVVVADASCNGICDGTATVNAAGGDGNFTFTWTPAPPSGANNPNATQMCAGSYDLNIVDGLGCFIDTVIVINEPNPYDFTTTINHETCTGDCDGTIDIVLNTGGVAPITFTYAPGAGIIGQGSPNASGFCPGNYTCTISDVGGCDSTFSFTINAASPINLAVNVVADNDCNGACEGVIQANANGGTGTLLFNWTNNPPTGQGTSTISDLCAGTYSVDVTDDNGCVESGSGIITEPDPYDLSTSFTDATCDGVCDGTATVTVNSGGTPAYSFQWDDPLNQTNPIANGLCAGNYNVIVSDLNGCDSIIPFVISAPQPLTISINSSGGTCFGDCTGSGTATINGGTPNYSIEWFDVASGLSIGTGLNIFSLCAGDYFAIVTDQAGCTATSANFTITENPEITATIVTTQSNCVLCDGSATITAAGGSGIFTNYQWTSAPGAGQGTPNGTNMCAGVYSVIITDDVGCTETIPVIVTDVISETITPSSTDVLCFGDCNGTATAAVVCSDPTCNFQWFDGNGVFLPGETNPNIGALCAGDYFVEVTNNSGCVSTQAYTINQGDEILLGSSFTEPQCAGDINGTATVTPTGGAGSFGFNWSPAPLGGQGTSTATGLDAGNWDVTVTDLNGCSASTSFTLTDPPILDVSDISSSDISCFGLTDGIATVIPTGGVGTYTYEWFECVTDVAIGQTGQQATGLPAGSYYVVVTDQSNCSQTTACVDVIEPDQLSGTLSATDVTCNGDCNGTAQVNPVGGINNYDFQWFNGAAPILGGTGDIVTNLCGGTYSVEITDLNGCVELISSVDVDEPAAFDVTSGTSDVSCFGVCDGTASLLVTGGTAPYDFAWSPAPGAGQGTANATQLCAGNYTILITDFAGCDTTVALSISSPDEILVNATVTDIVCNGDNNGSITTNVSGGAGGYIYNWVPNGEITPNLSNLADGTYTVNIQDSDGCLTDTTITLIEPSEITATFVSNNSTCGQCDGSASISPLGGYGGFNFTWTPAPGGGQGTQVATQLCAGIYSVDVTDQGGCTETFGVTVSDIGAEVLATSSTDATCFDSNNGTADVIYVCNDPGCVQAWFDDQGNPIGQTGLTATGLDGGDYFVQVTNNSGCISVAPVTVNEPTEFEANETITPITCDGDTDGEITVAPTGGTGLGFTYAWSPAPGGGQGTPTATGLGSGTWNVLITDSDGCDSTFTFTINVPNPITATISSTDILCNGASDGTAEVVPNGGSFPYTFQWLDGTLAPIVGETNSTITGQGPDDLSVVVTDLNGCSITVGPTTINEPVALSATISSTDINCFGVCDGTADVVITGGVATYTVNWFDGAGQAIGQTGTSALNLCAGDYFAIVIDNNGCTFTTPTVTIIEPLELTATVAPTDGLCDGVCDGSALVTVNGGTGSYLFNWLGSQGQSVSGAVGNTATGLCEDVYTVEIFDQNGCSVGPLSFNIETPDIIDAVINVNDASCNTPDGEATATPSGGTPNYNFQWFDDTMTPLAGETNPTLSGVSAGTYFVQVTDNAGCSETIQANIGNLAAPVITVDDVADVTCFDGNNGSIDISVTGVSAPFQYAWNPGGQVGQDLAAVSAGTYTVQVTDAAGCIAFETIDIDEPLEITSSFNVTDATCGLCDGDIVASASGGTGNLSLTWTTGQTGTNISNLCPGNYSVDITDDNGCLVNLVAGVTNIGGPTGESIVANGPSCNGGSDGDATVTPIGGTAPYDFLWLHDGTSSSTVTNLSVGAYYLQITDDNGCIRTVEVIISDPAPIGEITVITPTDCGACDGEILTQGDGGTGPYTYVWSHGPVTPGITNLCEGIYFVDITDNNGCTETFAFPINGSNGPTLTLEPTPASCDGNCDGSISSDTTGGTQPMVYDWQDFTGTSIGQTSDVATGLCPGEYILQVTDGAGCLAFAQAEITAPSGFQFSIPTEFDALCSGSSDGEAHAVVIGGTLPYNYVWSPAPGGGQGTSHATGLASGAYTVDVTDGNGCTAQQNITINEPLPMAIAIDSLHDALCKDSDDGFIEITMTGGSPGYQYSWTSDPAGFVSTDEDPTDLLPMNYIITVTDNNNCTFTDTIAVDTMIVVLADAGLDTNYCVGNSLDIIGQGTGSSNLSYTWYDELGNVIDTDSMLTINEPAGTYIYIFEAVEGVCVDQDTVVVTVNPLPIADAGPDIDIIKGEETNIGGTPTGPPGSTIAWEPNAFMSDSTEFNPTVEPDTNTTYIVTVIDENGCSNKDTMTVNVFPDIVFPNGFSPNGDGVNETWEIDFIREFPESVVEVYNRWGDLLFRSVGYVQEWDGQYNNKPLPVGTYYYIIELNHPLYPEPFTGPITILR